MIPLAIIVVALVIALAGGTLELNRRQRQKSQAVLLNESMDILAVAKEKGRLDAFAAPGLEAETAHLTDHLGQFERIVDPVQDLDYAKKLTGETPVTGPPYEAPPDLTYNEWIKNTQAAFGSRKGDPSYSDIYDLNNDGVIDIDDMFLGIKKYGGSPEAEGLTELQNAVKYGFLPAKFRSGVDPESAAELLSGHGIAGMTTLALAHTPGIIAEAASLGQMESIIWTIMDLTNASGLPDIVKTSNLLSYEVSVLGPARYHYNRTWRPMQPDLRDLPRMLARKQVTDEEYLKQAGFHGFDDRWAAAQWNIFLRLPEFKELSIMLWRGLIDDTGFKDTMLQLGWHGDVVDEMLNLAWQIPGPQDLVRFVVREVISPEEFIEQMGKQGFGPGYSAAFWDAHFRLPGPRDLIDAFHRGFISEAELRKYIFWHDYSPGLRPDISVSDIDIYKALTKTLIPRVDLRRAWAQGELSDAELEERYGWLGYEEDAPLMARIQRAIALTPHRGSVAKIFLSGLRKGIKTESEVRARLKELRYPAQAIDLLIEAENVRRDIGDVDPAEEPRTLSSSQIMAAYKKGLFTPAIARELLLASGWDPSAADTLIAINTPPPETERPFTQIRTAAAALYREGFMDSEEFEGRLRAANYSEDDITLIKAAENLRFRLDYLKDLMATAIQAYRKDIYTAEELEAYLLYLGMAHDRVRPLVAKEMYKKLPKLKA